MREPIEIKAFAKINLGLNILDSRPDGFHNIRTIMQRISLHDTLTVTPVTGKTTYAGPSLDTDMQVNLCVRAVEAFRQCFGSSKGADVRLVKQIPVGAGLGGGSSDAAAVLSAMAEIYEISLTDPDLIETSEKIGSDIPFFLMHVSAAIAEGRGEKLLETEGLDKSKWILISYPGFVISTAWAYSAWDKFLTLGQNSLRLIDRELFFSRDNSESWDFDNDFERPVFARYPELRNERDRLLETGARYASLSGSGSAIYGLFDSEAVTRAAMSGCQSWLSFVCRPY